MTAEAGERFAGLSRESCRVKVVEELEASGHLVQIEDYKHSVATCERCHTIIEPLLSEQWFAKMAGTQMIANAVKAIESDEITFAPTRYKRIILDWLENIRDWCISRQLWWGHRIPIYYAADGSFTAARSAEEAAQKLGAPLETLRQDDDVLDTWFSSALWPFATLGWPAENSPDLAKYYPTSVLTTAREILFLWVARMIMTGIEFTGKIPFSDVYIYATVLDKQGRRMSKSLGNGIDPLEMIEKYGADALRFSLMRLASKGQDIRFSEDRIPEARNFATKIWNAARFVLMNRPEEAQSAPHEIAHETLFDRWIVSKLQTTIENTRKALAEYDMDEACQALIEFFWNDYCDWSLELSKPALRSSDPAVKARAQQTLESVLQTFLKLLHPIMPFITEEIYTTLTGEKSIMYAAYPAPDASKLDSNAERDMEIVIASVRAIRNTRAELGIAPSAPLDVKALGTGNEVWVLKDNIIALESLAKIASLELIHKAPADPNVVALQISSALDLYLPLEGLIDFAKERARVDQEIAAIAKDLAKVSAKLANPGFLAKAAPEIIAKDQAHLATLTERQEKLQSRKIALG
jgi:valyl-tRNA synthetase